MLRFYVSLFWLPCRLDGGEGADTNFNGFVRTEDYAYSGGFDLPAVTAISGAAANPNQGYNLQPALAFLMTLFNVRLAGGSPILENRRCGRRLSYAPLHGSARFISFRSFSDSPPTPRNTSA